MNGLAARLTSLWTGSGFVRNVFVLSGGSAIGQALLLIAAPAITRLYSAGELGLLQVFISLVTPVVVVASLRYEQAILIPDDEQDARNIVTLSGICLLGTTFLTVIAVVVANLVALPDRLAGLVSVLWLLPVSVFGAGAYQILNLWSLRRQRFTRIAGTRLTQSVSLLSVQLLAGVSGAGILGLVAGDAVGRMMGSGSLARTAIRQDGLSFRRLDRDGIRRMAVRFRNFPLVSAGSVLVNTAGFAVPALILGGAYGVTVLGWFALVDRVLSAPVTLVGQATSQVFMGRAARLVGTDPVALKRMLTRTAGKLLLLSIVPMVLLSVFGPPLFGFVFGPEWVQAGYYIRILAPMQMIAFVVWPLINTLNIMEEQRLELAWNIGRLLLTVGGLTIAALLGTSASIAIAVYSAAMSIGYIAYYFLALRSVDKRITP